MKKNCCENYVLRQTEDAMKISRFNTICTGSWFKKIVFYEMRISMLHYIEKEIFLMNLDECIHLICTKRKKTSQI